MGISGTNYVLLGIAMATIFGVYAITTSAPTSLTATSTATMPYLLGHITLEVTDANGNIKSYLQTDNVLTNQGFACALTLLSGANDGCSSVAAFTYIALANNVTGAADFGDTSSGFTNQVARELGAASLASSTSFTIIKEFTADGAAPGTNLALNGDIATLPGETVGQTGLFDALNGGNMLAVADLSPTTVVDGDKVTVTWTIKKP